ncbi:MAG: relaxase/mobilization nuclease domain-containing protein [Clostridia bacterium]|nr:relaxase/mobilization nuclease domain-containing protein [Clostridia bacterium]
MAVTKIWPVRDRFDKVLDYAANAKKTDADIEKYHALDGVIDYAADGDKTEKCFYVSGVNCLPENAKEAFATTQKRYGKTTGKVAYHMYQSFAEGEVDAQTAHDIGVKLAEEVFGDRFEALVATHLNTDHFHNHIVINAVSWKDGLKYNDCKESYARIREVSDRLCREYGLSVVEHPQGKGMSYGEWKSEQEGVPTLRSSIRAAIDLAVKCSVTRQQFVNAMVDMGFIIDKSGKHAKIRHAGTERFVRFKSLGEGYSIEDIVRRVYANNGRARLELPEQDDPKNVFEGEEEPVRIMTYIPLFRSYDRAMKIAKERPYQNFRVYYLVRQDFSAKRLYEDTLDLLVDHDLKTAEDVINYKQEAMDQIDENMRLRNEMRSYLKRAEAAHDLIEADKARFNIGIYSMRLAKLRREVTTCDEVLERSRHVRDNLKRIEDNDFRGEHITRKAKNKDKESKNR